MTKCNELISKLFEEIVENNSNIENEFVPYNKLEFIYLFFSNSSNFDNIKKQNDIGKKLETLLDVFETLNAKKILYTVIKGPVNAERAFYESSNRRFNDLDILVPYRQIVDVEEALISLGFVQGYENKDKSIEPFSRASKIFYIHNTHQLAPFIKKSENGNIKIDVNFRLLSTGTDELMVENFINDRNVYKCLNGCNIYRLSDEKDLLFNIIHCYKDCVDIYQLYKRKGYQIKSFVDIYGLLKRNEFNKDIFNEIIQENGLFENVCYVFTIISTLFSDIEITDYIYEYKQSDINKFGYSMEYTWEIPLEKRFNKSYIQQNANFFENEELQKIISYNKKYIIV